MSFRYFPHAILFIGFFVFLINGIMIFIEGKFRIPFTNRKYLSGKSSQMIAILFFVIALLCVWDFIYIIQRT